ncbi:hypothetical protein K439DRAFT_1659750 [Ramaria rubella]|nr:hypothetical protein K439DRAFT_1659750 [Ramaria rubella]
MSKSSPGGGTRATSPNTQGNRPSASKHSRRQEDGRSSGDVFVVSQQGPRTPTKPSPPNAWFNGTEKFHRSPMADAPANQKRKVEVDDPHRTDSIHLQKTDAAALRAALVVKPAYAEEVTNPHALIGDTEDNMSIGDEDYVVASEDDFITLLKKCIDISAHFDYTEFQHKAEIEALYHTLGRSLILRPVPNVERFAYEHEGLDASIHATNTHSDNRRINVLEEAVADIASKFGTLTQVLLRGQSPNGTQDPNQTRHSAASLPHNVPASPTVDPKASFASGPTFKPTSKQKPVWNFAARHHESRLIVKITPVPPPELQMANSGLRIRDAINLKLRTNEATKHMLIGLVSWSNTGSAIINTADGLTAAELEPYAYLFTDLLPHAQGAAFATQTDKPWHKVTINGVPTRGGGYSDDMDSDQTTAPKARYLLDELLQYNGWLRTRKMVGEPRWISSPQTIATKDKSSIVVAFETQEDADELVKRRSCTKKPRCRLGAGEHTAAEHECGLCDSIGSTCEHTVVKCVNCPDSSSPHFADSYDCPYRKSYKGDIISAPKGGSNKKKKTKLKVMEPGSMVIPPSTNDPLNLAPQPQPQLDEQSKAALRAAVKIGIPSVSDAQVAMALTSNGYDLGAALLSLGRVITHTKTDTNQPMPPPWFDNIGSGQRGAPSHPAWQPILPVQPIPDDKRPWVMAYTRRRGDFTVTLRPTIICNIYNGKNGEDSSAWTLDRFLALQLPNELPIIFTGDWNMHHTLWEDTASNTPNARKLAESHDGKSTSVLDLTWVNGVADAAGTVKEWAVNRLLGCGSDHFALTFKIDHGSTKIDNVYGVKFNYRKADPTKWQEAFHKELANQKTNLDTLHLLHPSTIQLESAAVAFRNCLVAASEATVPTCKISQRARPWWTAELHEACKRMTEEEDDIV